MEPADVVVRVVAAMADVEEKESVVSAEPAVSAAMVEPAAESVAQAELAISEALVEVGVLLVL